MKPFSHYDKMIFATVNKYTFPHTEEEQKMLDEINKEKLTAEERNARTAVVRAMWEERYQKAEKDRFDMVVAGWEEFWHDCREELKYDQFLTPDGVTEIENVAVQNATDDNDDFAGTEMCFAELKGWIK